MLTAQKHLFQLAENTYFFNAAYMSPLLKSVEEAGIRGLLRKRNPMAISPSDFFAEAIFVKDKFGKLVNCPARQVAIIPSASYGLQVAISNLPITNGGVALIVADEFPSSFYTLKTWCKQNQKQLRIIAPSSETIQKGASWNEQLLSAINSDTAVVMLSHVHWADGTLFDLATIGKKCKEVGAFLLVDGTQSVGALPIDVEAMQIDALVCAAYKWLLGPYASGLMYLSEFYNNGKPLEETWMNRVNATDFKSLTNYSDDYQPFAARYDMGESSNFVAVPMLNAALTQLLEWDVAAIQEYCKHINQPLVRFFEQNGFGIEQNEFRSNHIIGVTPPKHISADDLVMVLKENQVAVSQRGNSIRISFHLFNDSSDVAFFVDVLSQLILHTR